ncbi:MAG: uncharacterized 2Fe-2S/4Fe-4S cluster protein (DUF4445 family) [Candidatus Poriferisodalaceae bacterium]|jgi:uncharacterized 2Fe-2S/4Fe-4S cluster protein (DUF4445 family)
MSDDTRVDAPMRRVVFTPAGLTGSVADGTTVLDAARALGADIDSVCGGRGICGRCQVVPSIGSFPKWGLEPATDDLSVPNTTEDDYRGRRPLITGGRLGCQAQICGDVVVDVPPESQIHRPVVRKDLDLQDVSVDPVTTLHYIEIAKPELGDSATIDPTMTGLIGTALAKDWGMDNVYFGPGVLAALQPAAAKGSLTLAVRHARVRPEVVAAWPGFVDSIVGVAVDIGSTTIAAHLCDLASGAALASGGRMNPQIKLGEDLMSRVSYVMMNPGGDVELTRLVRQALADLIDELTSEANVDIGHVLDIVLVGNPIMHHLVLGIDPTPLGQAPFVLTTAEAVHTTAVALDLPCPNARVYVGPCIAGHVGADTAAAVLSEGPHRSSAVQLLVDVGTNAEIVLGNRDRIFAASSPTGPAFEGAQISCGQRATIGAIERVRIDPVTKEPRFRVIGSELWSDEVGFAEAVKGTGVTGICGSGIIEVMAEMFLAGIMDANGVVNANGMAADSARVVPADRTFSYELHTDERTTLYITQNDVRAVQLAKGALRAGIDLLMEHAGFTEVDEVRLAGAFGAHINPLHALILGLIPDCPVDSVCSVGNAAGGGAVRALLSGQQRQEMETVVRSIHKIETATEPRFQELFVGAMALPHASAPTPHLSTQVTLPERASTSEAGRRPRRRQSSQSAPPEENDS